MHIYYNYYIKKKFFSLVYKNEQKKNINLI